MTPFYFGESQKQLYGVYHPPMGASFQNDAVLVCYPMGEEYYRTHRAIAQLSNKLAEAGCHVLRFDYYATGDSMGDTSEATIEQWLLDIETALNELKDLSAANRLTIIGLRFGAALAALASEKLRPHKLVLWDPIINGKQYLDSLKLVQQGLIDEHAGRINTPVSALDIKPDEFFGFEFNDRLIKHLETINLLNSTIATNKAYVTVTEDKQEFADYKKILTGNGIKTDFNFFENNDGWDDVEALKMMQIPPVLIQNIVNSVTNGDS